MNTLLRIDSSAMDSRSSFSRQLTEEFVRQWLTANPEGKVITRDLAATALPTVTADWIGAAYTPEANRAAHQNQVLSTSDTLIAELEAADEYVIGVPMYNFSIPAVLKLWIDQVARAGKTFSYGSGGPKGLLLNKKATFFVASGGVYDQGTPAAAMNFIEPYLRAVFAFLGVTDTTFINAGGTSARSRGVEAATILQPAVASIQAKFQASVSANLAASAHASSPTGGRQVSQ